MSIPSERVVVVGGTGAVGRAVVTKLLASPTAPTVRVSTRDRAKAVDLSSGDRVEVVEADLGDPASYERMFARATRAFLYVQPGIPLGDLTRVAVEAGVRHVVLLSSHSVVVAPASPIARMHQAFEAAIEEQRGLHHTFIRPGMFASNAKSWGWGDEIRATGKIKLPYPDTYAEPIAEDDIASVAALALTTDRLVDAAPLISGPESITLRQEMAAISEVREASGKPPVEVIACTPQEWLAEGGARIPMGHGESLLKIWRSSSEPRAPRSVEAITGAPGTTFKRWAEIHRAAFV